MKDNYKEKVIITITLAFLSMFGLLLFCTAVAGRVRDLGTLHSRPGTRAGLQVRDQDHRGPPPGKIGPLRQPLPGAR